MVNETMSAAEKLAEALPKKCPTYSTTSGDHVVCKKCGETWATGNSRACYRALETLKRAGIGQPAADGAQRVERMSDGVALELSRAHLDKGLSWAPHITRCNDLEIKALIRAIETHLAAAWGVKLDGEV